MTVRHAYDVVIVGGAALRGHTFDTVKGGDYLIDQDAAEIMCREAIDAVYDPEHIGMPFDRTPDGRIDQRRFGGHTHHHGRGPSGAPASLRTGLAT
jgi:succinate dehydrogenase/fumarate reductase flavoprotein subunit